MGQSPPSSICNDFGRGLPFFQGNAEFGPVNPVARKWIDQEFKVAKEGDVLISIRAPVGELNIAAERCVIGRGLAAIRATQACPSFTYYLMLHGRVELQALGQGSTFDAVNSADLRNLVIALPPLAEQRRIAEILGSVDDAIRATQEVIEQTRRVKQGLLQELLTKGIGHTQFQRTIVGEIPESWSVVSLSDLLDERRETSNNLESHPLYSLTIEAGLVPKPARYERSFLLKDRAGNQYRVVHPGDFVFNPMNLRWGAIARSEVEHPVTVSAYYNVLKPNKRAPSGFLLALLRSPMLFKVYENVAKGTLVEKKRVHLESFFKIKIGLPSAAEMDRITRTIDSTEDVIKVGLSRNSCLATLKAGLLQDLLTGKVRVSV